MKIRKHSAGAYTIVESYLVDAEGKEAFKGCVVYGPDGLVGKVASMPAAYDLIAADERKAATEELATRPNNQSEPEEPIEETEAERPGI